MSQSAEALLEQAYADEPGASEADPGLHVEVAPRAAPLEQMYETGRSDESRLPYDLAAEAAVLSAMLVPVDHAVQSECIDRMLDSLQPEDFFSEHHGQIFSAIRSLAIDGDRVDAITVANILRGRGQLKKIGGTAYLATIVDVSPAVHHLEMHAKIVHETRRLRDLIGLCQRAAVQGTGYVESPAEFIDAHASAVHMLAESRNGAPAVLVRDSIAMVFRQIQDADSGADGQGISMGLRDLDRLAGGLKPSLTIVGALSGIGKSALAVNIAYNVARAPKPVAVLVISLEMEAEELSQRMLFSVAQVDAAKIDAKQRITDEEWRYITDAAARIGKLPIWIDDRTDLTPLEIRARIRRSQTEARKMGLEIGLVVVDYLQLVNGRNELPKNTNREQEVAHVARSLKNISKQLRVPIIALAQLNADSERRAPSDKKPRLGDLRESKAIVQSANRVILIHNPHALERSLAYRDGDKVAAPESEVVDLIVAKNRGGRTGTVRSIFFPAYTLFADYTEKSYQ